MCVCVVHNLLGGFISCSLVEFEKFVLYSGDGFVSNRDSVSLNMECFSGAEVWRIWKGMYVWKCDMDD